MLILPGCSAHTGGALVQSVPEWGGAKERGKERHSEGRYSRKEETLEQILKNEKLAGGGSWRRCHSTAITVNREPSV